MKVLDEIAEWKREAADEDNKRYFYELDNFKKISNGSRVFVVGRKGVGKTAICKNIETNNSHDCFSSKLSFKDFPFNILYKLYDKNYTTPSQYISLWKFCIYNSILHMMKSDQSVDEEFRKTLGEVYREDPAQALQEKIQRWTSKSGAMTILGVGGQQGGQREFANITDIWHEILPLMRDSIKKYIPKVNSYFILFDELDEDYRNYWDDQNRDNYLPLLTGLLKAVSSIRHDFPSDEFSIKPVVFIRDDIYGLIKDPDKNKWDDLKLALNWDRGEIRSMLAHRISKAINPDGDVLRYDDAINLISKDTHLEVGRYKNKISIFDFIDHRAHMRPRDFVVYFRLCAESANKQKNYFLNAETIWGSQKDFSQYFISELENEINAVLPEFTEILHLITSNEIRFSLSELTGWLKSFETKKGGLSMPATNIPNVLFHFSVIGTKNNRGKTEFRYANNRLIMGNDLMLHRGIHAAYN